ncbi:hypothetical protein B0T22DRAFT_472887, partial [Podospora appendiculata]
MEMEIGNSTISGQARRRMLMATTLRQRAIRISVWLTKIKLGKDDGCLADLRVTDPRHDKKRIEMAKGSLL